MRLLAMHAGSPMQAGSPTRSVGSHGSPLAAVPSHRDGHKDVHKIVERTRPPEAGDRAGKGLSSNEIMRMHPVDRVFYKLREKFRHEHTLERPLKALERAVVMAKKTVRTPARSLT